LHHSTYQKKILWYSVVPSSAYFKKTIKIGTSMASVGVRAYMGSGDFADEDVVFHKLTLRDFLKFNVAIRKVSIMVGLG